MNAALKAIGLRFGDIATEAAFRRDFTDGVLPIQRAGLLIGLGVMLIFTVRDVQLSAVIGPAALQYRLFVLIPLFAVGLFLSFTEAVRVRHQAFFFVYCLALIVAVHFLYSFAPPSGATDPRFGFRAMSSMLLIVGVVCLSGLRFEYAILCGLAIVVAWIVDSLQSNLDPSLWSPSLAQLSAATMLSSGVSYWIERSHRLQFAARQALDKERAHAERLLSYSIPARALKRLRAGEQEIADAFLDVAVIFVDIVGFTDLSKRIGPRETVRVLNRVFTTFDAIVARHNFERVKTMGDGYLAIGGTSDDKPADVAFAVCGIQEMMDTVRLAADELDLPLALRAGLHVGPVIGGVIGNERPTYDYWGDTVNIASRLEATGEPGRIHCSEAVYWRLRNAYAFEPRGPVELKGYAAVQTYFVAPANAEVRDCAAPGAPA